MTAPTWSDLTDICGRLKKAGGRATMGDLELRYEPHVGDGRWVLEKPDGTCALYAEPGQLVAFLNPMGPREWVLEATP